MGPALWVRTLVQRATALVGANHPVVLDTLAAAHASEGRFDQAIETARQAAARVVPEFKPRVAQIEERLRLYVAHELYRTPE